MPRETIAAKVQPELKRQINQLAAASDITPSRIVEIAVEKYLGVESGDTPLPRLDAMQESIERLSEQMVEVERAIAELKDFRERLKRRGF